jgi:trehalose 6-phosphate synthase
MMEAGTRARSATVRDADDLAPLLASLGCGNDIIVVSNRAPWIHSHTDAGITAARPAGGLVTALEAVLALQGGCWIAHGSGSADRATCDAHDHVEPQHLPAPYRLRRVWLTDAEVAGYYDGLANEGLWPLCHRTGVAPTFRAADWACYRQANQRFADAVVAEARSERPVVLVQDYHLALVPQLVRARLPDAIIITFWHIPFPAPAALAAFPWRAQLLRGLAGSTLVGLQTGADLAHFEMACLTGAGAGGPVTALAGAYPISIAWPTCGAATPQTARERIARRFGVRPGTRLLLGVDRMDYTKGLVERLQAFELFLARDPARAATLTLLQIAAPSRASVPAYQELDRAVHAIARRINARFGGAGHLPVLLHAASVDAATVADCYRACDVCLVTPLHDGMNLVAKEFVAARADERGVLVLSRCAGAFGELTHALDVDPRDIQALADAMQTALAMPAAEQAVRMVVMRAVVRQHTVFRWAARLLEDGVRAAGHADRAVPIAAPARALRVSLPA